MPNDDATVPMSVQYRSVIIDCLLLLATNNMLLYITSNYAPPFVLSSSIAMSMPNNIANIIVGNFTTTNADAANDNNLGNLSTSNNNNNYPFPKIPDDRSNDATSFIAQFSGQTSDPTKSIDMNQHNSTYTQSMSPAESTAKRATLNYNQIPRPEQTAPSSRSSTTNNELSSILFPTTNNNKQTTPHTHEYITNYLSSHQPIAAQWGDSTAQIANDTYLRFAGIITKQSTLDNNYADYTQQQPQQTQQPMIMSLNNDTSNSTPILYTGGAGGGVQNADIIVNLTNDDFKSWVDAAFKWNITLLDDMMFLNVPNSLAPTGENLANYDPNNPWPLILYGIDNIGGANGSLNANPRPFFGDWANSFNQAYWPMHIPICMVICLVGIVVNFANIIVLTRPNMVSSINVILTFIASADLIVMASYIPYLLHYWVDPNKDPQGFYTFWWSLVVLGHSHLTVTFHSLSIWLTCTLAAWRYYIVCGNPGNPQIKGKRETVALAYRAVKFVAAAVPIFCIPNYISFKITKEHHQGAKEMVYKVRFSSLALESQVIMNFHFWIFSTFTKLIPCVLLFFVTSSLIRALRRHRNSRLRMAKQMASANGMTAATTANGSRITRIIDGSKPVKSKSGPNQKMLMLTSCWGKKSVRSHAGENGQSSHILLPTKSNNCTNIHELGQQELTEQQEIVQKKFNDPTIIYTNSNYSKDVVISDLDQPEPQQQTNQVVPPEEDHMSTMPIRRSPSLHHCQIKLDGLSTCSNIIVGHATINGIKTSSSSSTTTATNHSHSPTIHNSHISCSEDVATGCSINSVSVIQAEQLTKESTNQDAGTKHTQSNCDNINIEVDTTSTKNLERTAEKSANKRYQRVSLVSVDKIYEVGESTTNSTGDDDDPVKQAAIIVAKQLSKSGDIMASYTSTNSHIDNQSINQVGKQSANNNNNRGPRQCSLGELTQQQERSQLLPRPSTSNGSNNNVATTSGAKSSSATGSVTLAGSGGAGVSRASQSAATLHDRTTKLLIWIMAVFIICELPAGILAALCALYGQEFFENFYMRVGNLTDLFALINSVVNFTLYCLMNPQFKNTFLEVVMRCPRNKRAPTANANTGNRASRPTARSLQHR